MNWIEYCECEGCSNLAEYLVRLITRSGQYKIEAWCHKDVEIEDCEILTKIVKES